MAHAAGVQLDDLRTGLFNSGGVHVRVDIGFHDADAELILQRGDRALERGGLAASGRAHQVEQKDLVFLQLASELVRLAVVVFKNALFDFKNTESFHGYSLQ